MSQLLTELQTLFTKAFPDLNKTEQQQAIQLYKILAKGQPVAIEDYATDIGLTAEVTRQLLDSWTGVSFNDHHLIDGFWGASTTETSHRFIINQQMLYTWCAWDLLFMPVIFQQTIEATTTCPISKKTISLTISDHGVEKIEPVGAMITFIKPKLEALKKDVTGSFCQYIFFVESESTGKQWQQNQSNGFLLDINQGFELGKDIIQRVFKDVL